LVQGHDHEALADQRQPEDDVRRGRGPHARSRKSAISASSV